MIDQSARIAILMPTFYEEAVGGSEYQAYLLAEAAKQHGHEVHYIFVSKADHHANHLGLELHPMRPHPFSKRLGATWSLYYRTVMRLLEAIQPDVVYVRGGWSFAGMGALYARRSGCKSVWHVASEMDVTPRRVLRLLGRPLDIVERKLIDYAIRHSTHVVAQATYQADLLEKHYRRAATVIRQFQPHPEEAIGKTSPVRVVWIANLKPLKQPAVFLRLAREFRDSDGVTFTMIGRPCTGRQMGEVEAGLRELRNVEYLGEQPMSEVNRILASAHILVNTSLYEGVPNTFVQAWMRGVPVVSMLVDPDGVLRAEGIGCVSTSFEQMVKDVKELVDAADLRDEMGRRARTHAMEHHSLERNMPELMQLLCGIVEHESYVTVRRAREKA